MAAVLTHKSDTPLSLAITLLPIDIRMVSCCEGRLSILSNIGCVSMGVTFHVVWLLISKIALVTTSDNAYQALKLHKLVIAVCPLSIQFSMEIQMGFVEAICRDSLNF